jgi:hypothetical protein
VVSHDSQTHTPPLIYRQPLYAAPYREGCVHIDTCMRSHVLTFIVSRMITLWARVADDGRGEASPAGLDLNSWKPFVAQFIMPTFATPLCKPKVASSRSLFSASIFFCLLYSRRLSVIIPIPSSRKHEGTARHSIPTTAGTPVEDAAVQRAPQMFLQAVWEMTFSTLRPSTVQKPTCSAPKPKYAAATQTSSWTVNPMISSELRDCGFQKHGTRIRVRAGQTGYRG